MQHTVFKIRLLTMPIALSTRRILSLQFADPVKECEEKGVCLWAECDLVRRTECPLSVQYLGSIQSTQADL